MALRSGYKGVKKLAAELKWNRPGVLAVDDIILENKIMDTVRPSVIANTKLIKDTVGWTNKNIGKYVNQSLVGDSTAGFNLVLGGSSLIAKLEHNKDYIIKRKSGQGDRFRVVLFINAPSVISPDTSASQAVFDNTKDEYTISSGNYNYAVFTYVSSSSTAISQDTAEAMIYDADILDSTYEPYHESVDSILTEHKTTINAIITAATEAADFAAFKEAMAAITPVTRSLSREAVPETDPAEVIEEKTVTKKSTKKTTVKEGE